MQTLPLQALGSTSQLLAALQHAQAQPTRLGHQQQLLMPSVVVGKQAAVNSSSNRAWCSCSSSLRGCWNGRRSAQRASVRHLGLHLRQQQQQQQHWDKALHQQVLVRKHLLPAAKAD
jgi:hypothetical protein